MSSSSRLRRSASTGRLAKSATSLDAVACDMVAYPYCCTKHYNSYRRWPYYLDPDYPYYPRDYYWYDYPYYMYRRPWLYDDYYMDYVRGYEYGMTKYDKRVPYWWLYRSPYYRARYSPVDTRAY